MIPISILLDVEQTPVCTPEEIANQQPKELMAISAIGVLKQATKEGNPGVVIRVNLPDGKFVLAQTTLRLFQVAIVAFTERYGNFIDDKELYMAFVGNKEKAN